MPHEINRLLRAFAGEPWFIEPRKGAQIVALLEWRARHGRRETPWRAEPAERPEIRSDVPATGTGSGSARSGGTIAVLRLYGSIVPRMSRVEDVSATAASLTDFGRAFDAAAADPNVKGIVIDVDSPGGTVDLVPETAAKIRNAKRAGRPIVAVANTVAASAAYWIASAADELVVTPSGEVGSIGVYVVHEDISQALAATGVAVTFIAEGPRKVEGNMFEPLGAEARAALAANVRHFYDLFTMDVAAARRVAVAVVRADPEKGGRNFGGGRMYPAQTAVERGMADRVDTLEGVLTRLRSRSEPGRAAAPARAASSPSILMRRRWLALQGDSGDPSSAGSRRVEIAADALGHFLADVRINGREFRQVLIDTGATSVGLDRFEARQAGLRTGPADFNATLATANGSIACASVIFDRVEIGGIALTRVDGSVCENGVGRDAVIGMSFLKRLSRVEISGQRMVLEQ